MALTNESPYFQWGTNGRPNSIQLFLDIKALSACGCVGHNGQRCRQEECHRVAHLCQARGVPAAIIFKEKGNNR